MNYLHHIVNHKDSVINITPNPHLHINTTLLDYLSSFEKEYIECDEEIEDLEEEILSQDVVYRVVVQVGKEDIGLVIHHYDLDRALEIMYLELIRISEVFH